VGRSDEDPFVLGQTPRMMMMIIIIIITTTTTTTTFIQGI
jgi:hypothetical protein